MTFVADTSSRDFSGNRHTCDRVRQLRADLESLARGCLIGPDASFLPRQRCAPARATSSGAVTCALTAACVHHPNRLDRLSRRGSPTPSAIRPRRRRSTSTVTLKTDRMCRAVSVPGSDHELEPRAYFWLTELPHLDCDTLTVNRFLSSRYRSLDAAVHYNPKVAS